MEEGGGGELEGIKFSSSFNFLKLGGGGWGGGLEGIRLKVSLQLGEGGGGLEAKVGLVVLFSSSSLI